MSTLQSQIEQRLNSAEPGVEVLLVERSGETLRLFIDHPDGVTLGLCERVTQQLSDLLEQYTLEVSSPGPQRPLTKPDHFRRFVGSRARVRTAPGCLTTAGHASASITGELVGATEEEVTIAADEGVVAIPYSAIRRSHLVEE
jgi:ribosome maturation factor RimP